MRTVLSHLADYVGLTSYRGSVSCTVMPSGMTCSEAAQWLGVSRRTIYRMVQDGRLRPSWTIPSDDTGDHHVFAFSEVLRAETNVIVAARCKALV